MLSLSKLMLRQLRGILDFLWKFLVIASAGYLENRGRAVKRANE